MSSFSTLILLVVFLPVKTVARINYTVFVETLNHAQSQSQFTMTCNINLWW